MYSVLLLAASVRFAVAAVLTAHIATITPAPLVRRDTSALGYYQDSTDGPWLPFTYDLEALTSLVTHDGQIELCDTDGCPDATCGSDSWMSLTYSSTWTSYYCGSSSSSTCGTDLIYTDANDLSPLSYFYCSDASYSDVAVYIRTPTDTSAGTTPTDSNSTPTATSTSRSSTSTSPSPSPTHPPSKPTPLGAIVGGVIGGVAVIGAIIVIVIVVLRRGRSTPQQQSNHTTVPQNHIYPPPAQTYPNVGAAPLSEKTPATTTYYAGTGHGPASPPMSPAPQYAPHYAPGPHESGINELPEVRM